MRERLRELDLLREQTQIPTELPQFSRINLKVVTEGGLPNGQPIGQWSRPIGIDLMERLGFLPKKIMPVLGGPKEAFGDLF